MSEHIFIKTSLMEFFLLIVFIYISVYLLKRKQIAELKRKVLKAEEEMVRSHAEILTLQAQLHKNK